LDEVFRYFNKENIDIMSRIRPLLITPLPNHHTTIDLSFVAPQLMNYSNK